MTLTDMEIIKKYLPYIYYDKYEPFYPKNVGCTIFHETQKSPSFDRMIKIEEDVHFAIEYAIYWDFDIGHLYELEHIWIYVGKDGEIVNAEASFHGHYFNALLRDRSNIEESTHIRVYSQPGKHAFMPKIEYFYLLPDLYKATNEHVGNAGLLVADMFEDQYSTNDATDQMIKKYLQQYAFTPSMDFEKKLIESIRLMPWEDLKVKIPVYIESMLKEIKNKLYS